MSDKYYMRSVHERLMNAKKYINCFTKRDKQELKTIIKYVERLLDPKVEMTRDQSIKMMDRPNAFLNMLIETMHADIGDQDNAKLLISNTGSKKNKMKYKSKSKKKIKKSIRRK